jgi:hypothetical protein
MLYKHRAQALTTVILPNATDTNSVDLNRVTNTVYALNPGSNNVSVISGVVGTGAPDFAMGASSTSLSLHTIIVGPPYCNTVDLSCTVSGPGSDVRTLGHVGHTGPAYGTATLTVTPPSTAARQAPSKVRHLSQ